MQVTAFEHYMAADDRPTHPMTFWLRATFAGVADRARLAAALNAAVGRHPLLRARLSAGVEGSTSALRWLPDAESAAYLDVAPAGQPLKFPQDSAGIDLTREAGLRLFARQGPEQVTLLLQVHHAAADALGATKVLGDILAFYAGAEDSPAPLRTLDPSLLAQRGDFHLSAADRRRRLGKDLARIALFFRKFPRGVAVSGETSPTPFDASAVPTSVGRELRAAEVQALKTSARRAGATLNDLLLRDLFLTLDAWNREHGGRRALRLAMPINMRQYADEPMPAANVVSMCFLDRAGADLDDAGKLLQGIVHETTDIKSYGMGLALIRVAEVFGRWRGGLKWLLTPRLLWRCAATAVLSNLGDPFKLLRLPLSPTGEILAGGLVLKRLELLPPVRPHTALALGVVTYAGRLALTLHYDQTVVGAAEAQALVDAYAARLEASMDKEQASEESNSLFARLLKEHAVRRQGAEAFYSLPIGKNVAPVPALTDTAKTAPLLPAPQPPAAPPV